MSLDVDLREQRPSLLHVELGERTLDPFGGDREERREFRGDDPAGVEEGDEHAIEASGHGRVGLTLGLPQLPGSCGRDKAVGLGNDVPERCGRGAEVERSEGIVDRPPQFSAPRAKRRGSPTERPRS